MTEILSLPLCESEESVFQCGSDETGHHGAPHLRESLSKKDILNGSRHKQKLWLLHFCSNMSFFL